MCLPRGSAKFWQGMSNQRNRSHFHPNKQPKVLFYHFTILYGLTHLLINHFNKSEQSANTYISSSPTSMFAMNGVTRKLVILTTKQVKKFLKTFLCPLGNFQWHYIRVNAFLLLYIFGWNWLNILFTLKSPKLFPNHFFLISINVCTLKIFVPFFTTMNSVSVSL